MGQCILGKSGSIFLKPHAIKIWGNAFLENSVVPKYGATHPWKIGFNFFNTACYQSMGPWMEDEGQVVQRGGCFQCGECFGAGVIDLVPVEVEAQGVCTLLSVFLPRLRSA